MYKRQDEFYRHQGHDLTDTDHITLDGTTLTVQRSFGNSTLVQRLHLHGRTLHIDTDIDWHETEKLLKAAFPLDVHADRSTAETQFGHLHRPTHTNTTWDAAKFEICAHRWLHVGEHHYGHALINDSTYGHDVTRHTRPDGGTTTTARLSLLRAPRFPDPDTDHGHHHLRYALVVGADIGDAIREGYRLNLPPRTVPGGNPVPPLITLDNPDVIVEALKPAEDRSGDIIVRLYESRGGRATTTLTPNFPHTTITPTDLLERPTGPAWDHTEPLTLRPVSYTHLTLPTNREV